MLSGKKIISWNWFEFSTNYDHQFDPLVQDHAVYWAEIMIELGNREGELLWTYDDEGNTYTARGYWKVEFLTGENNETQRPQHSS